VTRSPYVWKEEAKARQQIYGTSQESSGIDGAYGCMGEILS